mgnify:FL=1
MTLSYHYTVIVIRSYAYHGQINTTTCYKTVLIQMLHISLTSCIFVQTCGIYMLYLTLYRRPCQTNTTGTVNESKELKDRRQANTRGTQTTATETQSAIYSYAVNSLVNEAAVVLSEPDSSTQHVQNPIVLRPDFLERILKESTDAKSLTNSQRMPHYELDHVRLDTKAKRLSINFCMEVNIPYTCDTLSNTSYVDTFEMTNEFVNMHDEPQMLYDSSETSTMDPDDLFRSGSIPINKTYASHRATNFASESSEQCSANYQNAENRTYEVISDKGIDDTNVSEASIQNDTASTYVTGRIA